MDISARWWILSWHIVRLNHVWSWRRALKDLSQLQLLTGTVSATWKTDFRVWNISASRSLKTLRISVVSFANMLFKQMNLLSERNHFKNWFVPLSVQLSSAASMPAGSGTAATHRENCEYVIHIRALCVRSWFVNLLHTENCRWGRDSRACTVLKVVLCYSPTHTGQRSWVTSSNCTAKISAVLLTSV